MFSQFDRDKAEFFAFEETIAQSTVGIATHNNRGIGTGTFVRFEKRCYLVTADHVFAGTDPACARYFACPGGSLVEHSMIDGLPAGSKELSMGTTLAFGSGWIRDEENDVAVVQLVAGAVLPGAAKYHDLSASPISVRDGASVIVLGYPVANSAALSGSYRMLGMACEHQQFSSELNRRTDLHSSYDPKRHFLIPYSRCQDGIEPEGFSGGAAWCNLDSAGAVWQACPQMVGVVQKHFRRERLLQILKVNVILQLLQAAPQVEADYSAQAGV